jgi:predicted RNA polymerase sigma factor
MEVVVVVVAAELVLVLVAQWPCTAVPLWPLSVAVPRVHRNRGVDRGGRGDGPEEEEKEEEEKRKKKKRKKKKRKKSTVVVSDSLSRPW